MTKHFDLLERTTPGTDPQDPGYDIQINYVATRAPTTSEPLVYNNLPFLMTWWQEAQSSDSWATYNTQDFWLCLNNTADNQVWAKMVFDSNILSVVADQGWQVNTSRSYTGRDSPAFSTSYTPSATNDTQVLATVQLTSDLLTAATVDFEVNSGGGFSTVATISLSGLTASATHGVNFLVAAGSSYRLIDASGTCSITSINEISL